MTPTSSVVGAAVALTLASLLVACGGDDKAAAAAAASSSAAGPQKRVLDGKLGAAVAAAEAETSSPASKGAPAAASADPNGPPPNGVFAPGQADTIFKAGAEPKIELMSDGTEPRVALKHTNDGEQKTTLAVTLRFGQGGLPLDFDLISKPDKDKKDKDKKDKDKDAKDKDAKDKDAKDKGPYVLVKIAGVSVSKDAQGNAPKGLADVLGKVKGSELRCGLRPDGSLGEVAIGMKGDADPGLGQILQGLVEALSLASTPLPSKPVGAGAFWMTTDRTSSFVGEVLRYRVFRVQKLEGEKASVSIELREYATHGDLDAGPDKGKLLIDAFDAQGKGTEDIAGVLPKNFDIQERMQARIGQAQQQQQQAQAQVLFVQLNAKTR